MTRRIARAGGWRAGIRLGRGGGLARVTGDDSDDAMRAASLSRSAPFSRGGRER